MSADIGLNDDTKKQSLSKEMIKESYLHQIQP